MTDAATAVSIHVVTWHEAHRHATDLAARVATLGPWSGLIAVSRGGLVPAAIVARALDISLVETICLSSYEGQRRGALRVFKKPPASLADGRGWLLIDDVADSGATAAECRRLLPAAHHASVYVKPAGRPYIDTFLREFPQDVWIDFPWERAPAEPT